MPGALPLLAFGGLACVPGLVHAVTTRRGGVSVGAYESLNLGGSSGDRADSVAENRRRVAAALGIARLVFAQQVHGRRVAEVEPEGHPGAADALVVGRPGALVGVLGADCALLLLVDEARRVLAVVHAGWRGTASGVLPSAVAALARGFGSRPGDLRLGVGPAIAAARYPVGADVAERVGRAVPGARGVVVPRDDGRFDLDLRAALVHQARAAGVLPEAIEILPGCTYAEATRFFSHRRDGAATGRHALVAGWSS